MEGQVKAIWRASLAIVLLSSMVVLMPGAAQAAAATAEFPSPGTHTWTVPAGVTSVVVEAWGGGGAGGGSTNGGAFSARGGGGGGGGAYASSTLPVTPGQVLQVVVGAGGLGVAAGNGGAGGASFVGPSTNPADALVRAAGGLGGTANTAGGNPAGGAGGSVTGSVGVTKIAGDPGQPGDTCFTSCSGAGGRGAYGGGYGGEQLCGPYVTSTGNPGNAPGGGGGGGRTSQYNGARAGGAGAAGKVVIRYDTGQEVCATIWPTTNVYDLASPGDVTTLITWNDSASVSSIHDGTGYLTQTTHYTVGYHDGTATLTIKSAYLAGKLTAAGQSVTLTIRFNNDDCQAVFTINAVDTSQPICPTISPTTRQYNLASPANQTTTITWNDAVSIVSITDGSITLTPTTHYTVAGNTLTILTAYLGGKLTAAGQIVTLAISFDICVPLNLTITAIDTSQPECITISPSTGQYNLGSPGDVTTTITDWGDVGSIASIHDGSGFLTPTTHYTVVGNTVTIKQAYLAGKLTAPGQSVVLTLNCDPICATPFVIMAAGTQVVCPTITPTTRQYNLASPANQTTTITWNSAASITSITDGSITLTPTTHYTVAGNTLTILTAYLAGKLTVAGQSVALTISFDVCTPLTLTITAVDTSVTCPTISPTTRQYNLASPANQTTTITWNSATSIVSITDGSITLTPTTHYTVAGNTLTVLTAYLAGKLTAAGQSVTLTINFDICAPLTLTITAIDTSTWVCATISPTEREYNLADVLDVTTLITWHDSPHEVASIHDGTGYLAAGTDYTVQPYNGTARLTIRSAYLGGRLTTAGGSVVLTIKFVDNCEAFLTITAIDEPVVVGLAGYPVNKLTVVTPWIALLASIVAGAGLLALRRRRA